jgi:energy-coupling factor transport system ATP-binding protein
VQEPAVQFERFGFQYRSRREPTLMDINLSIYPGEKVLILGASGSGKSTLANCINGLIPFSFDGTITGTCRVNGMDTRELSVFKLSREVGTVLQDCDAQFVGLSVGEDIAFAMENDNIPRASMRARVRENSAAVGMEDFLGALPFHLSGGQKQKAAFAGVLDKNINILIFDEPLASLDPKTGTLAIDLIDRIVRERGCCAVIIEHRLEDVLYRPVDRIILMDKGRIVADTVTDELLRGGLLRQYGIREPLYITAMKYAACDLDKAGPLGDPEGFELSLADKEKLRGFFVEPREGGVKKPGDEVLKIEGISFAYDQDDKPAVENLSFSVRRGERIALIGKNGAGKSTVAKLLCGICRPMRGKIYFGGQDAAKLSIKEIGERVGYVMQDPNQMIVKDIIKEEVELALRLRFLPEDQIIAKGRTALETCELYRMRNWPVNAISYGQKKRVTVASVLALEPDIIILDEPTAGQDYRHYTDIINFINRLNAEYGKTIILITHDMHLAIENTDRAIVFAESRLIADGEIFTILSNRDVVEQANLKQTSLHTLSQRLGIAGEQCIERYIQHEKTVRGQA